MSSACGEVEEGEVGRKAGKEAVLASSARVPEFLSPIRYRDSLSKFICRSFSLRVAIHKFKPEEHTELNVLRQFAP